MNGLLAGKGTTFLRRADRRKLGRIDRDEVMHVLRISIEQAGRHISAEALEVAADGTGGYPFMIQLVGLHTWRPARGSDDIEVGHTESGVARARTKVGDLVHASAIADLSERDREQRLGPAPRALGFNDFVAVGLLAVLGQRCPPRARARPGAVEIRLFQPSRGHRPRQSTTRGRAGEVGRGRFRMRPRRDSGPLSTWP